MTVARGDADPVGAGVATALALAGGAADNDGGGAADAADADAVDAMRVEESLHAPSANDEMESARTPCRFILSAYAMCVRLATTAPSVAPLRWVGPWSNGEECHPRTVLARSSAWGSDVDARPASRSAVASVRPHLAVRTARCSADMASANKMSVAPDDSANLR